MSSKVNIKSFMVGDKKLNPFVDSYYSLSGGKCKQKLEFTHFPHYKTSLVFMRSARSKLLESRREIRRREDGKTLILFNNNTQSAIREVVFGEYKIVGIVFKTLGANNFLLEELKNPSFSSTQEIERILRLTDDDEVINGLDCLLKKIRTDGPPAKVTALINKLVEEGGDMSLDLLSSRFRVSRRTALRYFKKYKDTSFRNFRSVVRFRKALETWNSISFEGSLSDLAYISNYYDQSDFIKEFRSKAIGSPKRVLKDVHSFTEKLIWRKH